MPARASRYFSSDEVVASGARTVTGISEVWTGFGPASSIRAQLNVTAASGTTPTLDVVLEDTVDGGTTWNVIGTFIQKTAAGREVINITGLFTDSIRARWTVAGTTPSFTFTVNLTSQGPQQ